MLWLQQELSTYSNNSYFINILIFNYLSLEGKSPRISYINSLSFILNKSGEA